MVFDVFVFFVIKNSGAAAVAEGVVEAVDEAAGIKDVQHQEEIAVEEAHIGAK